MSEHQHKPAETKATETKPATKPAAAPTPATTSQTKPAGEKVEPKGETMDFNAPATGTSRPSAVEAAPASPETATTEQAAPRRGRPPKDPNAAPSPATPATPPKAVGEMGLGELLKAKEKAVADVQKAHEMLGAAMPRLLEIAAAIRTKLA